MDKPELQYYLHLRNRIISILVTIFMRLVSIIVCCFKVSPRYHNIIVATATMMYEAEILIKPRIHKSEMFRDLYYEQRIILFALYLRSTTDPFACRSDLHIFYMLVPGYLAAKTTVRLAFYHKTFLAPPTFQCIKPRKISHSFAFSYFQVAEMDKKQFYLFVAMMFAIMKLFKDALVVLEIDSSYHFIILPAIAVTLYGSHIISPDIKKSKILENFRTIISVLLVVYGILSEYEPTKMTQICYSILTIIVLIFRVFLK